ncbi:multicopper oxidase domain-containing protein [Terrabacter sp. 2YAF2]|uniref:multicopper oxidase domain-containing protein n=1 Tax=Terrabacter sp. 2YAF2 TaxID=3233026 RepID=UPI003F953D9B
MTSRPSLRLRLGASAVAAALATPALVATTAYAVAPASGPTSAVAVAPATAPAAAPAAAVGKLTPTAPGCTVTPASAPDPEIVSCDLWAKPGTNEFLSQSIPIWGYSTTEAGPATAPGPVIVAKQGDRVVLTLHNGLAEATALALPAQPASSITEGLATTATTPGIAPGATARYTFTASRAGTFLYEAGHTAGGARQVAMGLAGALVVLSTDGTAYGQSYDDEAVLVLSEIDPALNADPAKFTDLREFKPKFRLINGKPFPSTDPVATDQAHKVLLRYVNAGTELHPMSLLGGEQQLLSQDGHALGSPEPSVVAAVDPGVTMDSLVTMPSGPEAKLALFESAAQLDNGGQAAGVDPTSVAFGGMLTFLDTNAPPPSTDVVGPASTAVGVTPNPANGLGAVTVSATVTDANSGGSAIDQAELVVDDDVATVAAGTSTIKMTGTFGSTSAVVSGTIPASATPTQCSSATPPVDLHCLSSSKHTIYVRGHDAAGNWGVVGSVILNLAKTGPQTMAGTVTPNPANGTGNVTLSATGDDTAANGTITAAEYFTGTPGVDGQGTPMSLNRQATKVALTATVPAATVLGVGEGTTHLFVHSRNSQNIWGPPLDVPLVVDVTAPRVNAASVGPNPTNGVLSPKAYPGYLVVSTEVEDRDAGGATQSNITGAEAFLDPGTAPVSGKGLTLIAVDGAFDSPKEQAYGLIPLTQVTSLNPAVPHFVNVHAKDAAGNWGSLTADNAAVRLIIDKTAPVLGALTATPNPTSGPSVALMGAVTETVPNYVGPRFQAAEYWIGTTDPGVGKATRLTTVFDDGANAGAEVPVTGLPNGAYTFHLRLQDAAGNWSNASTATVTVVRPNLIFSDGFDTALSTWSARFRAVAGTTAAGIPAGGGNVGLAATVGARNTPAYVVDDTPLNESTYHAQFSFDPNTLTTGASGTAWATVFEGRTTTGQAFAVQYHRVGTGATAGQVRIVMSVLNRNRIATTTGPAVNLTAGAHTVKVDWVQGTTGGTLKLTVDGVLRDTRTGNNSGTAMQVQSARLGVIATTTNTSTMAGTAWFDSFISTRNIIP